MLFQFRNEYHEKSVKLSLMYIFNISFSPCMPFSFPNPLVLSALLITVVFAKYESVTALK